MYPATTYSSPVGTLTMASDGDHLIGLWIEGQKYFGAKFLDQLEPQGSSRVFDRTRQWLDRYFAGEKPLPSELPLSPIGTDFSRAVWQMLCDIPYGEVTTYGALARRLADRMGRPSMSAQAIGGAVGHNPISIIIPCHRVVGQTGSLTGYAGGIDRKLKLLTLEGVDTSAFFRPTRGTAL